MATANLDRKLFAAAPCDFNEAARRIASDVLRTPLLPYASDTGRCIRLKCENLQPLGSFKIRSGASAVAMLGDVPRVTTASAGNFAQGLTLAANRRGIAVTVHAPETAAGVKLAAMRALGANVVQHPFAAGHPVRVERKPSFVDGIGSNSVLDEMWPLLRELIDDVIVVSIADIRAAVHALAMQAHIIAEGAGAAALAAAMSPRCGGRNVAAIISGGNIDAARLAEILTEAADER